MAGHNIYIYMAVCLKSIQRPIQCPPIGVLTFTFGASAPLPFRDKGSTEGAHRAKDLPASATFTSGTRGTLEGCTGRRTGLRSLGAHCFARGGRTGGHTEGALRVQAHCWGNTFLAHGYNCLLYTSPSPRDRG